MIAPWWLAAMEVINTSPSLLADGTWAKLPNLSISLVTGVKHVDFDLAGPAYEGQLHHRVTAAGTLAPNDITVQDCSNCDRS